jgi:pimeloyl-ACP methyl ester carboxylesterase
MSTFADGNAECCLTKRVPPSLLATLKAETERCNPTHLAQLMRDHAQLDWRPILPRITIPVLNVYGSLSGCFPEEGLATIGQLIPHTTTVVFSKCNHWLYMEEPGRFNDLICKFCSELF